MEEAPSSPTSVVVNSPRRTLSLVRRIALDSDAKPASSPPPRPPAAAFGGPKPAEVYGFVGSITTVIATVIYLAWAYMPEPWLHSLGITYYPNKYWALAVPAFAIVSVTSVLAFYVGLNFMATPSPTSFSSLFDEHTRELFADLSKTEDEDRPIEPISDIGIDKINNLMFGEHQNHFSGSARGRSDS